MNEAEKYYKHSGAFSAMGPLYMIVLGVAACLVLGFVYGYAIFYIPLVYVSVALTLLYGAGVGYLVNTGGRIGKVRSSGMMFLFGLVFGLVAVYTGWVSWLFAASKQTLLVLSVSEILSAMKYLAEEGVWTIFGWTPKGVALYAFWAAEAVAVTGTSTLLAWVFLDTVPFCERCNKWVKTKDVIFPLEPISNPQEVKTQLENGDYAPLMALNRLDSDVGSCTRIELLHCPTCDDCHFLSIKSIYTNIEKGGKKKTTENPVLVNLILTPESNAAIRSHW